jgi:HPt (histidine-containing phosphotransfer) domain-containing protein
VVSVSEEAELEAIWLEFRPQTLARIDLIRQGARGSLGQAADAVPRRTARMEAHTLAGSAAIFGMSEGARIAREMEALLDAPGVLTAEDLSRIESLADELTLALSP